MAERPKRRPVQSAAQIRLKQLEARLAHLEDQLKALRTEASGSVGAVRSRLEGLERRAAEQISLAQNTLKQSLDSITRALAASREGVESKAGRLSRAVRAGMRAGSRAYRGGTRD
jgi:chromosome segregation ATPase